MPVKRLLQDVITRWNSIYYLLDRLVEMRWPIPAVLSYEGVTKRSNQNLNFKKDQWDLVKAPLKQTEVATIYFSEDSKVSISSVLPILCGIMDNLPVADEDSSDVKSFKETVTSSIKRSLY